MKLPPLTAAEEVSIILENVGNRSVPLGCERLALWLGDTLVSKKRPIDNKNL